MARASHPAIVIDAAISKHLEVLSSMRLLGIGIAKGINHRCSVERPLHGSIHTFRKRQTGRFQNRGSNVSNVSELRADFSLSFNARWPLDHDTIRGSAIVRRNLLRPLKWRVASPGPANCVMRKRARVAPIIQMRHVNFGGVDDSVQ